MASRFEVWVEQVDGDGWALYCPNAPDSLTATKDAEHYANLLGRKAKVIEVRDDGLRFTLPGGYREPQAS